MKSGLSKLKEVLERIDDELRQLPASLIESGKGEEDPDYDKQTRRLEGLQARLSISIKELQARSEPFGPEAINVRNYARKLERDIKTSQSRAASRSIHELLAEASEKIHEYHEIVAIPPVTAYVPEADYGGSWEAASILLFSVIARMVQKRKRRTPKQG